VLITMLANDEAVEASSSALIARHAKQGLGALQV